MLDDPCVSEYEKVKRLDPCPLLPPPPHPPKSVYPPLLDSGPDAHVGYPYNGLYGNDDAAEQRALFGETRGEKFGGRKAPFTKVRLL